MIGIDLGTTNSLVAHLGDDGQPVVLENELGESMTPSAVAVAEDGTVLVGRAALDRLVVAPTAGRAFFKRDMGTEARYTFGGRSWSPEECSARILQELKRVAELRLGREITEATITVPAYFHDDQRRSTLLAARLAGLKVSRLLNEPTAAALAYGFQKPGDDSTLLVFDLGGGTFDVTLLEIFDGVVEVKATAGVSRLGGEDYTELFSQWLTKELGTKPTDKEWGRWRAEVEQLKRKLTRQTQGELSWQGQSMLVTREDFAAACHELTGRLWPVIRRCLRDGGITPQHLTGILLVGGASRMPFLAEGLQFLLQNPAQATLDPDRVVALGAAVQQALVEDNDAVRDLVLTDVCPHSLGVMVVKEIRPGQIERGFFEPIIDRNSTVPISRQTSLSTIRPEQDEIRIQVYQGESRLVDENQKIGELRVAGLRHLPNQKHAGEIDVRFTYDMNSVLEVEVTHLATGHKTTKVFEQRPGQLTEQELAEALDRMAPLKMELRNLPIHRARLERANRLFSELVGNDRAALNSLIDAFERSLASQNAQDVQRMGVLLDDFMNPFFQDDF
jgi:molecular chaperone HscC